MKKTIGIAIILLALTSCASVDYLSCPAFSSTESQNQEDFYVQLDCENCDEID